MKLILLLLISFSPAFSKVKKISGNFEKKLKSATTNCDLRDLRKELIFDHRLSDIDADLLINSFSNHVAEMVKSEVVPEFGIYGIKNIEEFEKDLYYNTGLSSYEVKAYIKAVRTSQLLSQGLGLKVYNSACTGEDLSID